MRCAPEAACWVRLGCGVTILRVATLALMHSTTGHCAPLWGHSTHTCFVDSAINDALQIVSGCLLPTPADNLSILADIQPELHHNGVTLSLARHAIEPEHLLYPALARPLSADVQHLKSRQPFVPAAEQLISLSDNNICEAHWADHERNVEWMDNPTRLRIFIHLHRHPPKMTLPRRAWVWLNCLCTAVGRFCSCLYK